MDNGMDNGSDKRMHARIPMEIDVEVRCPDSPSLVLRTADLSHVGLLLMMESDARPSVGTQVTIQVVGMLGNGEPPPVVKARVVRHVADGFAVIFEDV